MPDLSRKKGFTLIEVIAVLVVISIVGVIAVSRMISTAETDIDAKAEALKGHIRHVQIKAMSTDSDNSNCKASYGMGFTGSSYFMFRNCDQTDKVVLPGADNVAGIPVAVTAETTTAITAVTFDKYGRPCTDQNGNTLASGNISLKLGTKTIAEIKQDTGYVP